MKVTIDEFTAYANHDIQLNQSRYEVVGGANYRITFRGRADSDRDVSIGFSRASEPWSDSRTLPPISVHLGVARLPGRLYSPRPTITSAEFTLTSAVREHPLTCPPSAYGKSVILGSLRWSGSRCDHCLEVSHMRACQPRRRRTPAPPGDRRSNPPNPRTLPDFRMFAVLGTWMEEDVVAATVCNALAQGCEGVYLVDNGSTDGTVEAALRAGAILGRSFQTDRYAMRVCASVI